MGVTHTFVSGIADDPVAAAAGQVLPSHWNATHTVNVNLASEVSGVLPVANGGNGTATPSLVAGSNVTVTGTWPGQTIASVPSGSTTQLQYNNAGAFDGASGLTTNGTELTIASGTKTASAPAISVAQTWNNAAVTFTGAKINVTDTASNAASLLLDLQVGGTSRIYADKNARIWSAQPTTSPTANFVAQQSADGNWLEGRWGASLVVGRFRVEQGIASLDLASLGMIRWSNNSTGISTLDLQLTRKAAASLQLGAADAAAPVAQTIGPQSVVAGTSNTAGQNFTVRGSQGTGTGVGGDIIFQVAPAGSSGTAQNTLVQAMRIYNNKTVAVGSAFTVATLPAAGTQGRRAWVTDATAPTFLGTLTGGGTVVCPVFDNGTAWVAG